MTNSELQEAYSAQQNRPAQYGNVPPFLGGVYGGRRSGKA